MTADARAAAAEPAPATAPALDVFISYSRRDALEFAKQLKQALEALGHTPIIDLAGISAGEDFQKRLGDMIVEADTVVFVLSPESVVSPVCAWEIEEARRKSKRVLPVLAMPLDGRPLPEGLCATQYIPFCPDPTIPDSGFGHGVAKLAHALKSDVEWLREHKSLLLRAEAWDERGREADRLIRGTLLAETELWLSRRPAKAPDLTPTQQAYLEASRQAEAASRDAASRQLAEMAAAQDARATALAEREAALRQAKAEQEARADEAKRRGRLQMILMVGAIFAAMGFGAFGWFAWGLSKRANVEAQRAEDLTIVTLRLRRETQVTESGLLANAASQLFDHTTVRDAGTAMLLTLEAMPDAVAGVVRPFVSEAHVALDGALRVLREGATLAGHTGGVVAAAFSPHGTRIVTASDDGTARLWAADGAALATLAGHRGGVTSAAFSADGTRIVTASDDRTARLWAADGAPLATLAGHTGAVTSAAFSGDGTRIVTASDDGTARLWAADGAALATLGGHTGGVTSAAFSPDGTRIVTASWDTTALLWATDGTLLATLAGHTGPVFSASFSPLPPGADGTVSIISASVDRTARLWRVFATPQALVNAAKDRAPRCLTQAQRKAHFLPPAPPAWCVERRRWPYHTDAWQDWLPSQKAWLAAGRPEGRQPPLPDDAVPSGN